MYRLLGERSTTTISLSRDRREMQMVVDTRSGKTLRLEVELSEGINNMQANIHDEDGHSFSISLSKEKETEIERNRETMTKISVKINGKTIKSEVECSLAIDNVKATVQDKGLFSLSLSLYVCACAVFLFFFFFLKLC